MEYFEQLATQYPFLTRGIFAACILAVLNGLVGSWIHCKKIHNVAGALSHALFAPIAIAVLLTRTFQLPPFLELHLPILLAYLFAAIVAVFMTFQLRKDFSQNFFSFLWALGMAIGISVMVNTPGYSADLHLYLFGNLFLISYFELTLLVLLAATALLLTIFHSERIKLTAFEPRFAKTKGIATGKIELIAMLITAFAVVTIVKAMGIILLLTVFAFPTATAASTAKNLRQMVAITSLITLCSLLPATVIAYHFELLLSPLVVFFSLGFYVISKTLHWAYHRN